MVGSTNTGKSSIRTRLSGGDFLEVCASTVLLNFATWCPKLDDKELRVEIMDMAGAGALSESRTRILQEDRFLRYCVQCYR